MLEEVSLPSQGRLADAPARLGVFLNVRKPYLSQETFKPGFRRKEGNTRHLHFLWRSEGESPLSAIKGDLTSRKTNTLQGSGRTFKHQP